MCVCECVLRFVLSLHLLLIRNERKTLYAEQQQMAERGLTFK